jgi:MYXO-CTERM domain-containing protein
MRSFLFAAIVAGTLSASASAAAFSTRVHIAIANETRAALVASGGSKIPLKLGPYAVTLSDADAKAILNQPLAFRAGAIGPDNVIFPGMTDPSHAIEQQPYTQCEILYGMAATEEERAYAIGCFLHGATDAIAHHYVNYFSGETFTLTPITAGRMSSWSNVVRHIVAESMVQKAALGLKPTIFSAGAMAHAIPKGFVLRAYFDTTSPLWKLASEHARAKYEATKAAKPTASMITWVSSSGLAPGDQLLMAPYYVEEIEAGRKKLRDDIANAIKAMQDPTTVDGAKLKVTAGSDGVLGTLDDKTACTASCASLYAKYFTYVSILKPRKDASGASLPSAFDKISDELGRDLRGFSPAMVATIENVSAKLNGPLTSGGSGLDLDKSDIATLFQPLTDWSTDLTTIDYATVTKAVVPDWLATLEDKMKAVGISISIPDIVEALMQPVVQPIKDALKDYVVDQAQEQIGGLIDAYKASEATVTSEYQKRLATAAGSKGTALANFFDSGLWNHSFNIAAAAMAKHALVLPEKGDVGPATFDGSYTPAWMQAGVCDYLRTAIFPLGIDVKGSLSVRIGDKTYPANVGNDSPVECHQGSLTSFTGSPSVTSCNLVTMPALLASKVGSVSRAYPPSFAAEKPSCTYLAVDGLPPPPEMPMDDAGVPLDDSGVPLDDAGNPENPDDPSEETAAKGGCACTTTGPRSSSGGLAAMMILGAVIARRRKWLAACLPFAIGCSSATGVEETTPTEEDADQTVDVVVQPADTNVDSTEPMFDSASDTFEPIDTSSPAGELLAALGTSVWSGTETRVEGSTSKTRAYEMRFDASSLSWGEVRNPWGPARMRTLRVFTIDSDGKTVHSTILSPAGWPVHPDNGKKETWTFELSGGKPRTLKITSGGKTETFTEGLFSKPKGGLTAEVRVFSTTGKVNDAFCSTGAFSSIDRAAIWEFARGKSTEKPIGYDFMAGAKLTTWVDTSSGDNFAVTDVPGFKSLGGTLLSDQRNFVVRYFGLLEHPGGVFKMRELDDDVKDAVWAFVGDGVAGVSLNTADLYLEVHGKAAADSTPDEPTVTIPAGSYPIEIFVLRCAAKIQQTDVQVSLGGGAYQLVGNAPTTSDFDVAIFPPVL